MKNEWLTQVGTWLADLIWPHHCVLCDAFGAPLCNACNARLQSIDWWQTCPRCGAPWSYVQCGECVQWNAEHPNQTFPLSGVASAVFMDDAALRIVAARKDAGYRYLAVPMAQRMVAMMPPHWQRGSCITYIPSTKRAYRARGFDHAYELAREVASASSIPLIATLDLPRAYDQRRLSRTERFANMQNALSVKIKRVPLRLIIVDDVYTTGATMCASAQALLSAGACHVYGLTFGRVY